MILCMIFFFCFFFALCHRELAENGLPMIRQTEIEHRIVDMSHSSLVLLVVMMSLPSYRILLELKRIFSSFSSHHNDDSMVICASRKSPGHIVHNAFCSPRSTWLYTFCTDFSSSPYAVSLYV